MTKFQTIQIGKQIYETILDRLLRILGWVLLFGLLSDNLNLYHRSTILFVGGVASQLSKSFLIPRSILRCLKKATCTYVLFLILYLDKNLHFLEFSISPYFSVNIRIMRDRRWPGNGHTKTGNSFLKLGTVFWNQGTIIWNRGTLFWKSQSTLYCQW